MDAADKPKDLDAAADAAQRTADELEHRSDEVGKDIDEARAAQDRAEGDEFIPAPLGDGDDKEPGPGQAA